MARRMLLLMTGLFAAVLLVVPAAAGEAEPEEADDTVQLTDNVAPNVKILDDNWQGVKYTIAANVERFDAVSRVKSVEYGTRLPEWDQAEEALRKADYAKAEGLFKTCLTKKGNKLHRQYYLAGLVQCYEGLRNYEELRKRATELITIKPAPRVVYEPYLKMGDSFLRELKFAEAQKAFEDARKFFEGLEKTSNLPAGVRPYVQRYKIRAGYMVLASMGREAEVMPEGDARNKRLVEVSRAFGRFTAEASGEAEIVDLCKTNVGRYKAMSGDEDAFKELLELAERKAKEARTNPAAEEALAAAWVGLGDAAFLKLDYEQARWYYLSTIVKCPAGRASVARAHYMAGQCYDKMAEKTREREAEVRARRHYETVIRDYPESTECAAAGKRLEEKKG